MNILFISDVYFPRINGVSTSTKTFREEFIRAGHRVILIAPEYPGCDDDDEDIIRVPSSKIPFDPEDRLMNIDASYGTFNTWMTGMTYASKIGSTDYMVSGKAVNSDSIDDNWYRQRNVMAKVDQKIGDNNNIGINTKYYLNGYLKSGSVVTDSLFDINLGWKSQYEGDASLKLDGYFCEFNQDDKGTENKTAEISALYNAEISEGHVINAGFELRREDFTRLATSHRNENIYSLFIEEELDLSEKLAYVAAASANQ